MQNSAPAPELRESYKGYYINLDRSPDRRAQIEAELARRNLNQNYQRFAAADGNILKVPEHGLMPGILGCWTSHYLLLKQNLDSEHHLHVIEDDAIFADCTEQVIRWAIDSGQLDNCDILFTDVSIPLLNDAYKTYKALYDKLVTRDAAGNIANVEFQTIDLTGKSFASTNSYLVNKKSVSKLYALFDEEMQQGPRQPIDLFIRKKGYEKSLRIGCVFPFVTSVRFEQTLLSNIDARDNRQPELAADIARYAFFVGCDWNLCLAALQKYVQLPPPEDKLAYLLGHLLTYSLTDRYRFF